MPATSTGCKTRLHWRRALLASTAALSLGQNAAWAACLDGTAFPPGGYQIGSKPVAQAANWSPNVFTSTEGSYFIPDISTNDQTTGAPTGGGHNWAFDQGSTLCKQGDAGKKGGTTTAWILPPNTSQDCIILPIIKGGKVTNLGDIPFQGSVVTPVCDPEMLSNHRNVAGALASYDSRHSGVTVLPANTYANQLGCSIAAFNNGGVPRQPLRPPQRPSCSSPASRAAFSTMSWTTPARLARPLARSATTATSPRG